jgi:hypothetical protein
MSLDIKEYKSPIASNSNYLYANNNDDSSNLTISSQCIKPKVKYYINSEDVDGERYLYEYEYDSVNNTNKVELNKHQTTYTIDNTQYYYDSNTQSLITYVKPDDTNNSNELQISGTEVYNNIDYTNPLNVKHKLLSLVENNEEPNVEEPNVDEPNVEEPNVEEPNVEEPNVEEPSVENDEEKTLENDEEMAVENDEENDEEITVMGMNTNIYIMLLVLILIILLVLGVNVFVKYIKSK